MMNTAFDLEDYGPRDPRELMAEMDAVRGPVNPVPANEATFWQQLNPEDEKVPF